jgi:hypothetical protein
VLLFSSILLDLWRVEAPPRFLSAKAITGKDSTFSSQRKERLKSDMARKGSTVFIWLWEGRVEPNSDIQKCGLYISLLWTPPESIE